jgi:CRP-like cAMP-binding protein
MSDQLMLLEEVCQIRKLLELLAEPAVAQRDAKLRNELRAIVGSSSTKQQSVILMNGKLTQSQIANMTGVHQGNLSTMIGKLEGAGLLVNGKKQPKLAIHIPEDFFDAKPKTNGR